MRRTLGLTVLLLVLLAGPPAAVAAPVTVHMTYTGSAFGLDVMELQAIVAMDQAGYRIDITYHTVGVLAVFMHSEQHLTAWGSWRDGRPEPERFWLWGYVRGSPRETLIDYEEGMPLVRRLTPPTESDRDPVPDNERADTIDTLSALAFLVRHVEDTGSCNGRTRVFDGRRLSEIDAHTVGLQMVASGTAGPFQGEALHCDFAGRQLAGFTHDEDFAWQNRPHNGAAWIAKVVAGGPPIPVRLSFATRLVGDIIVTLVDAGPGPAAEAPR